MTENSQFDALLVVSFGGPEGPDDVMPFLENVLRGKNVPRERMLEVAEHYHHFDGVSPINEQNRALISALKAELACHQIDLPIYWGNRNWHPLLTDTLRQMEQDGIKRALAFFTSAYSCYSGCRQYRENIAEARAEIGPQAPEVAKLRMFFNHPLFIEASASRVRDAFEKLSQPEPKPVNFVFTAHSIPLAMADGCRYVTQLRETCRLIMDQIGDHPWELVYQSRSGPPSQPWLEPDICDYLEQIRDEGAERVVVMPVGFISDHMEVLFDLDTEARQVCDQLGIQMVRASSVGTHRAFISMIRELILERTAGAEKRVIGAMPASHDVCPVDCCLPGSRPTAGRPPQARTGTP